MISLGIVASIFAIGFLCWLVFTLAIYALPFFVGMTAGMAAFHTGAGVIGATIVGFVAAAITLGLGQLAFDVARVPILRAVIALLFAVPAGVAGYYATLGIAHVGVPSVIWREVFATIGAICVGCTSLIRITGLAVPSARERIRLSRSVS